MESLEEKEIMRTWRTGIYKIRGQGSGTMGRLIPEGTGHRQFGFTLIELMVVLSILSITLTFVIPRFMGREEAELKSSARKLLYATRKLSDDAVFKKEKQTLHLDLDNNEYGKGDNGKMSKLPPGVSIDRLLIGKEEIRKGTAFITIFPSGFRDEARIHLSVNGNGYTVVIPALGERFEILEE